MTERFNPPFYMRNAHIQSTMNSIGPRRKKANTILEQRTNTEQLLLDGGEGIRLMGEYDQIDGNKQKLAVIFHGWEGNSRSSYVVTTSEHFLRAGYNVLRLNFRDHGDSHHLTPTLFNATLITEVANAVDHFSQLYPHQRRFLLGFSLGGNFALRIANDFGEKLTLTGCAAVCPPIDPERATRNTEKGLYHRYFFKKWQRSLQTKLDHYPDLGYHEALASAKTVSELVDFFVPDHTPADTPKQYFSMYALVGDRLQQLSVPSLLLTSKDDPIIPFEDLAKLTFPPALQLDLQQRGGHCGFISSLKGDSWAEQRLLDFCETCVH